MRKDIKFLVQKLNLLYPEWWLIQNVKDNSKTKRILPANDYLN